MAVVAAAFLCFGSDASAQKTTKLFNGKDLSGWNFVVDKNSVPARKALCFITSVFSDCLTFSALASRPQLTHAAFHRMVCDGCYHARTIPDGE